MMICAMTTAPQKLRILRERAGLSMDQLAKRAGYKGASSIQRYESEEQPPGGLPPKFVSKVLPALVGRGEPPIEATEVLALIGDLSSKSVRRGIEDAVEDHLRTMIEQTAPRASGVSQPDFVIHRDGMPDMLLELKTGHSIAVLPRYDIDAAAGTGTEPFEDAEPLGFQPFEHQWLRGITRAPLDKLSLIRVSGDSMWETLHEGDQILVDRTKTKPTRDGLYVIRIEDDLMVKRIQVDLENRRLNVISDNPRYPTQSVKPEVISVLGRVVWIGRRV